LKSTVLFQPPREWEQSLGGEKELQGVYAEEFFQVEK
jgi:hypothetical protein